VTPWNLNTFTESVNQSVTPESKLTKVAMYARGMADECIITVPGIQSYLEPILPYTSNVTILRGS